MFCISVHCGSTLTVLAESSSGAGFMAAVGGSSKEVSRKNKKTAVPKGLNPDLERACEAVFQNGWRKICWPKNFSALHLAARLGSEDAVRYLLDANAHAGLESQDDDGKTPLAIAIENKKDRHPS